MAKKKGTSDKRYAVDYRGLKISLYVLMHSGQKCDSCVLIRVSTVLICLRASDKSKNVQVETWSIGQTITPMQNMECREDYNVCTELGVICDGIE